MAQPQEVFLQLGDLMNLLRQNAGYLWSLLKNDKDLRLLQATNAPQIVREANQTVTDAAVFSIPFSDNQQQQFSALVVISDEASGKGRFSLSNRAPSAGGNGAAFPSGGARIVIRGNDQIRKFQIIGETGATLNLWYALYQ